MILSPYEQNSKSMSLVTSVKFFYDNRCEALKAERLKVFSEGKTKFLHDFYVSLALASLKESFTKDLLVINELRLVEELDSVLNSLFERLYELYGLYYPEASYKMNSPDSFYKVLKKGVTRDVVSKSLKLSKHSIGMNLTKKELSVIVNGVNEFLKIFELRETFKKHVDVLVSELLPNTVKVAGSLLTAKLLSEANSFKKLALMPSSTIQIIGAEKALFNHLTTGSKCPKHGVILQHNLMQKVKRKHRGRLARVLSSKINLCVKVDYFTPDEIGLGVKLSKKVLEEFNKLK